MLQHVPSIDVAVAPATKVSNEVVAIVGAMGQLRSVHEIPSIIGGQLATEGVNPVVNITTGQDSSTPSTPGRLPSPVRTLSRTPRFLGITIESFAESEIHELEEIELMPGCCASTSEGF